MAELIIHSNQLLPVPRTIYFQNKYLCTTKKKEERVSVPEGNGYLEVRSIVPIFSSRAYTRIEPERANYLIISGKDKRWDFMLVLAILLSLTGTLVGRLTAGATTAVLVLKRIADGLALVWAFHKLRKADNCYNTFAYSMVPVTKDC